MPRHGWLGLVTLASLACSGGETSGTTDDHPCEAGRYGDDCQDVCACPAERCDDGAAGSGACEPLALSFTMTRDAATSPNPVVVDITLADGAGSGVAGLAPEVTAATADVSAVQDLGGGAYRATVTPAHPSGELPITVRLEEGGNVTSQTRVALVLPNIAAGLGQPEAVPGLVNTPGYEDGIEVSHDGEWLFVGSYSPVDVISCISQCGSSPSCALCQTVLGPYGAPERPGMPGAERIVSPTQITNQCPKLCYIGPDGGDVTTAPLPPVGAFGFRRQADGSFAEPFVMGLDADGCNAPFGYSLTTSPNGTSGEVVFAFYNPDQLATHIDLYWAPVTLGSPNIFARYSCTDGVRSASDVTASPLTLFTNLGAQGNPAPSRGLLFFDDEYTSTPPRLLVATASGELPVTSFFPSIEVPVGLATDDRRQPFFDEPTLYFTRNFTIAAADLAGDPTQASAWSPLRSMLAPEAITTTRAGAIISLGEPSVAARQGHKELYFVYAVKTATGLDLNAGRVSLEVATAATETVVIDLASPRGPATGRAGGFLFGIGATEPDDSFITPLRPAMFRTAEFYNLTFDSGAAAGATYERMDGHTSGPVVMALGIKDYFTCPGCGACTDCEPLPGEGDDWAQWEARVSAAVNAAAAAGETYAWDIWNEPDLTPWSSDPWPDARFRETWRTAVLAIRAIDPNATIIGPSTSTYDQAALQLFLNYADVDGVLPNVMSWHEFGPSFGFDPPDQIPAHVDYFRTYTGGFISRYQINEWMGPFDKHRPGMAVWFFANLERAGVEHAARSCWMDDACFNRQLGGLLTDDRLAPRSIWWAHKGYTDLEGELVLVTPSLGLDGVAAAEADVVRVLVGNHDRVPLVADLHFVGIDPILLGACVQVRAEHIANSEEHALPAPALVLDEERVITSDELHVVLPEAAAGDAFTVEVAVCPE